MPLSDLGHGVHDWKVPISDLIGGRVMSLLGPFLGPLTSVTPQFCKSVCYSNKTKTHRIMHIFDNCHVCMKSYPE